MAVELLDLPIYTPLFFYSSRLETFTENWPHNSTNLLPEKMAEAGFFFYPDDENKDNVSCPFCLKNLTGWEDGDDPIVEHAKRQDVCYFARLDKNEKDWTVEDFLRLLAQRRASIMTAFALSGIDGAKNAVSSFKKWMGVLADRKTQKKSNKRKK